MDDASVGKVDERSHKQRKKLKDKGSNLSAKEHKRRHKRHSEDPKKSSHATPVPHADQQEHEQNHRAATTNGALALPNRSPSDDRTPFYQRTASLYVTLSPIGQSQPLQSLCVAHLSPLLLTYYPPFHGVVLAYSNPRLADGPSDDTNTTNTANVHARSVNEYAAPFVWLIADVLVLSPQRGDNCEGYITIQDESSIGLICWNFFSASIQRDRLPRDWEWKSTASSPKHHTQKLKEADDEDGMAIDELPDTQDRNIAPQEQEDKNAGYWLDGNGKRLSGVVHFRVRDIDATSSTSGDSDFVTILGTMLSKEDEERSRAEDAKAEIRRLKRIREENTRAAIEQRMPNHGFGGATDVTDGDEGRHRIIY